MHCRGLQSGRCHDTNVGGRVAQKGLSTSNWKQRVTQVSALALGAYSIILRLSTIPRHCVKLWIPSFMRLWILSVKNDKHKQLAEVLHLKNLARSCEIWWEKILKCLMQDINMVTLRLCTLKLWKNDPQMQTDKRFWARQLNLAQPGGRWCRQGWHYRSWGEKWIYEIRAGLAVPGFQVHFAVMFLTYLGGS